jgi:hypothetical protein
MTHRWELTRWVHKITVMPEAAVPDHDQRLKVLLKEFIEQFFRCFFPDWAERFDFAELTWLDKEVFLAPPQGEKRHLDLVARVRLQPGVPPPQPGATELLALLHIEIESRESVQPFRPRMFEYYVQLRRDTGLPVLPIGLYLRVGLDGIGWDAYEEHFWEHRLVRFEYAYVGLPALDAEPYVTGVHLLGAALSSLMRVPAERRAELHAEALKRIAQSSENDWRRYLLAECLEAYARLDDADRQRLHALLTTEAYQEARPLMITTFERGKHEGLREGLREAVQLQLEVKFGPLPAAAQQRLAGLTPEQVRQLLVDLLKAESLRALHLED